MTEEILSCLPMVARYAQAVHGRCRGFPIEDLYSAGAAALVESAARYDRSLCPSLWHFARLRVYGAMVDEVKAELRRRKQMQDVEHAAVGGGVFEMDLPEDSARARMRRALEICNQRDLELLRALYEDGVSTAACGERLGVSKSSVSRRHTKLIGKLRRRVVDGCFFGR